MRVPAPLVAALVLAAETAAGADDAAALGARLFKDVRFATPKGDLPASCSDCHLLDENAQGLRAHADFLARSWFSYRPADPRREELRNSPTLFDVAKMPRLHFDGEFASLEDLVRGTLSGRPMGWLPSEQQEALEQVRRVALMDEYPDLFRGAYGVALERLDRDQVVDCVARAISDYMRTLRSERTSPYDLFLASNALEAERAPGETAADFAGRLLAGISRRESEAKLALPGGFDSRALAGLKVFLRTDGSGAVGNCVACHVPPLFTDLSFHNIGVSQLEYDQAHGDGSFAALTIPGASRAVRPSSQLRQRPSASRPGEVDLGHWNFVDLRGSPIRRPGETDDQFLERMTATFKTPSLRNLRFTDPYMHNGAFASLEGVLAALIRLSDMARAGRVRAADDALARMRFGDADVPDLVAFLSTLNQDLKR